MSDDKINQMLHFQKIFQDSLGVSIFSTEYRKDMILAMHTELSELLQELDWKPWRKTVKIEDIEKIHGELSDIWHFLINLTMSFGIFSTDEIYQMFMEKHIINKERQKDGY